MLFVTILCFACESESQEPNPIKMDVETQGNCIQASAEGLLMKFCMLDIQGNAQKSFEAGENFSFSLVLKNESEETITIKEDLIDSDFFEVTDVLKGHHFGKPYTGVWCEFSLAPREIKIESGESIDLECPWKLESGDLPTNPFCKSETNENLIIGDYITGLNTNFTIKKGDKTILLDGQDILIQFTIN